ncbi:Mu transposase domain-containing protein [Desulfofundulus kuznetsovii]|uniref:Mu transposase domain-containing protein n=1 Tax=Desulfofundulus kuznetsovii TaxID=58135 RepID=UPI003EBFC006
MSHLPLPEVPFELVIFRPVRANRQALVHFDDNRYSVSVNVAHGTPFAGLGGPASTSRTWLRRCWH